jgi:hypothetical protein
VSEGKPVSLGLSRGRENDGCEDGKGQDDEAFVHGLNGAGCGVAAMVVQNYV